jgi:hypothetical protein
MATLPEVTSRAQQLTRKGSNALPYNPLDAKCPRCGSAAGRACVSSTNKKLRYAHTERTEAAAAAFRAEVRLRILDKVRRHPFSRAFSPRLMVVK